MAGQTTNERQYPGATRGHGREHTQEEFLRWSPIVDGGSILKSAAEKMVRSFLSLPGQRTRSVAVHALTSRQPSLLLFRNRRPQKLPESLHWMPFVNGSLVLGERRLLFWCQSRSLRTKSTRCMPPGITPSNQVTQVRVGVRETRKTRKTQNNFPAEPAFTHQKSADGVARSCFMPPHPPFSTPSTPSFHPTPQIFANTFLCRTLRKSFPTWWQSPTRTRLC